MFRVSRAIFWAYFQAGKIGATLLFAPILLWIIPSSHSAPWTYYCSTGTWGCSAISPYGLPWYGFYRLLSMWSNDWNIAYLEMNIALCVIDTLVFYQILHYGRSGWMSWLYYLSSFFFLYWSPSDLLPFWLGALALLKWPNMILALVTKLPLGAPLWVWSYIWQVSLSSHNLNIWFWFNLLRYPLLGLWMVSPLVRKGLRSRKG